MLTREEAIKMIDEHNNKLINPVEMLNWTHLRVMLLHISDDEWVEIYSRAYETLSR